MIHSKHGFMTVYVCLFLVSLMFMCMMFISGAKESARRNSVETLGRTWQQSILAEYDLNLQQRYHIFGFYGYPAMTEDKLTFYIKSTFDRKEHTSWQLQSCSLYPYSLQNPEIFKKQMIEGGKQKASGALRQPEGDIVPTADHKELSADKVFENLPSEGSEGNFDIETVTDVMQGKETIGTILKKGTDGFFQLEYIFSHFRHKQSDENAGECYFQNEIEYILAGKKTDEANGTYVRNRIIAVREVMNFAYLNSDSEKKQAALAAAEVLTPGPAATVTQQSLLALWALAESINDYNLLMEGYAVPYIKTDENWAVDLASAMENREDHCIYTGVDEGEFYEDYLRLLLSVMREDLRTLRVMDVVQINMRQFYYDGFSLSDYYGGLFFVMKVNGESYEMEETYF